MQAFFTDQHRVFGGFGSEGVPLSVRCVFHRWNRHPSLLLLNSRNWGDICRKCRIALTVTTRVNHCSSNSFWRRLYVPTAPFPTALCRNISSVGTSASVAAYSGVPGTILKSIWFRDFREGRRLVERKKKVLGICMGYFSHY